MDTGITTDWASFPTSGLPAARHTGPFPFRDFLQAAWTHQSSPNAELTLVATGNGDGVAFSVAESRIEFVGPEHLTDYHTPVGDESVKAVAMALGEHPGSAFRLDSLPAEAATTITAALDLVGADHRIDEHAATAVLALPDTFDAWLEGIGKKERHEVRRKRRRFEATYGEARLLSGGIELLDRFARMHRSQPGDKGGFMTEAMEAFFAALITDVGAVIHTLNCGDRVLAASFGFETSDGYYYYNSAFETEAAQASPGVVLLSMLVESQIDRGASVFDFLKGEETYKYRHGATRRPLFVIEGTLR